MVVRDAISSDPAERSCFKAVPSKAASASPHSEGLLSFCESSICNPDLYDTRFASPSSVNFQDAKPR
ncbi:unnamed protein product [Leptosia nina]|uniref:Uncharacterized protein n=1 Tax=Leptosia nina TaxID=320188 RepID=A0AAV1K3L0_9NEOP